MNDASSRTPLTPGQLLAARHRETMTPGQHGVDWEAASDVLEALAQIKVGRSGLRVHCMPRGGAADAPGWYDRARELIGLEGDLLPCAPDRLQMGDDVHFAALANLYGIFLHECGHATHTLWTPASLPARVKEVAAEIIILEEPRMEARVAHERPLDARWLRASSQQLDLDEQTREQIAMSDVRCALLKCVLVEGRVEAGVLTLEDALPVSEALATVLDAADHNRLRQILAEAVVIADGDLDSLEGLARELAALLPPDPHGAGDGAALIAQLEGAAQAATAQASAKAAAELAERGGSQLDLLAEAFEQAADEQRGAARGAETGESEDGESDEAEGEVAAQEGTGEDPGAFTSVAGAASLGPLRMHLRPPTIIETLQRERLALRLRRAKWRSRQRVSAPSLLPPGRLRARAAMQARAQQQMGALPSAMPWRQARHQETDLPYPRVAILADVSTSMKLAAPLVSSTVWVVSHAVHDCGGSTVAVAFGDRLSLLAPRDRPSARVMDFETYGGTAFADLALQMAYDELDLGNPVPGPRLVVVVSDGGWSNHASVERKLQWLIAQGVQVLIVDKTMPSMSIPATGRLAITEADQLAKSLGAAMLAALQMN